MYAYYVCIYAVERCFSMNSGKDGQCFDQIIVR